MKLTDKTITITPEEVTQIKQDMLSKKLSKGAAIRKLFAEGFEVKTISTELGILYNHCYNVVQNEVLVHGLEITRGTRGGEGSKKKVVLELLHKGMTIRQVSEELKMLYNSVWQIAKAAGLTPKQIAASRTQEEKPIKNSKKAIEGVA